jgi:hypothetical protein
MEIIYIFFHFIFALFAVSKFNYILYLLFNHSFFDQYFKKFLTFNYLDHHIILAIKLNLLFYL